MFFAGLLTYLRYRAPSHLKRQWLRMLGTTIEAYSSLSLSGIFTRFPFNPHEVFNMEQSRTKVNIFFLKKIAIYLPCQNRW